MEQNRLIAIVLGILVGSVGLVFPLRAQQMQFADLDYPYAVEYQTLQVSSSTGDADR